MMTTNVLTFPAEISFRDYSRTVLFTKSRPPRTHSRLHTAPWQIGDYIERSYALGSVLFGFISKFPTPPTILSVRKME